METAIAEIATFSGETTAGSPAGSLRDQTGVDAKAGENV